MNKKIISYQCYNYGQANNSLEILTVSTTVWLVSAEMSLEYQLICLSLQWLTETIALESIWNASVLLVEVECTIKWKTSTNSVCVEREIEHLFPSR